MGSEPVVLEISSDEEDAGLNRSSKASLDWLSELFDHIDEPWESDDVVVVDELSCAVPIQKHNSTQLDTSRGVSGDDSDDDCKVLDADPNKPVDIIQDKGDGSDDLLIVGEKGQLACRDYPHPRHLCATFPFSTTAHVKHCNLCHCYVCDSLAPCTHWGSGASTYDHCHSTDKEVRWKVQRKLSKGGRGNAAAAHTQKIPGTTLSRTPPVNNSKSSVSSSSLLLGLGSIPLRTPISRSNSLRACSTTGFGTPSIISQRRNQQSSVLSSNQRFPQQLHRSQLLTSGTHSTQRERRVLAPQIFPAHPKFRRSAAFTSANMNKSRYSVARHSQMHSRTPRRNQVPPVTSVEENFKKWQDVLLGLDSDLGTDFQPHTVYSQPEVYTHSLTQAGTSQNTDVFQSSDAVTNNPHLLLDDIWLDDTSLNDMEHASAGNPQQLNVQPSNLHASSESNPDSGETPLGSWRASFGKEPTPEVANDQRLFELDPAMSIYDAESMWDSLGHL